MRLASSVLLALLLEGCTPGTSPQDTAGSAGASGSGLRFLQGGEDAGFARAIEPRDFRFPEDHGPHGAFRSEWWYLTGNVSTPKGRRLGFQATFFRFGLKAEPPDRSASGWRATQAWMAHIAVVDETGRRFVARERMAREALGLAGSDATGFGVRVEDWALTATERGRSVSWMVSASDGDIAINVTAVGETDHVIAQGDRGLDRKGPEPGNASYYYSMPRLRVNGTLRLGTEDVPVSGVGWLDREWGTSALSDGIEGWDWFALQLDDGSNLMYYRLRRPGGVSDPFSSGTLIDGNGETVRLGAQDVVLRPTVWWQSAATLVRYPVEWQMDIPERELSLHVRGLIPAQELDLSVRYWEGAVEVGGARSGGSLQGLGYLELTGYGAAPP